MRLVGFIDELIKLGTSEQLSKVASAEYALSEEPPPEMVGSDTHEPGDRVSPEESSTRLPRTAHLPSGVAKGHLGRVTEPKEPVDGQKFNRPFETPQ